jgi:xanthine dehydrogenase accessory factor
MMQDVLAFAAQKTEEGKKVALVTVTETSGSSPASPGQMIAVLADGTTVGTVGGGASEYRIIQQAQEAIKSGQQIFRFSFDHAESGMICGGAMAGFGNVLGSQAGLCIFGGGHISQCLARIAVQSGFFVTVVEDRPEFASGFEHIQYVVCGPQEYKTADPASASDYAVICTRGHKTDGEALRYCLSGKFAYIGMIGSEKKVTTLLDNLRAEGVDQAELDRIYAPIGLDIADALPAEIAVAILAEILLVKNKGRLRHKKEIKSICKGLSRK